MFLGRTIFSCHFYLLTRRLLLQALYVCGSTKCCLCFRKQYFGQSRGYILKGKHRVRGYLQEQTGEVFYYFFCTATLETLFLKNGTSTLT